MNADLLSNEFFAILANPAFWVAVLRIATPLVLGTLGVLLCERAGVLNLGIEGIMVAGAFAGWLAVAGGWIFCLALALIGWTSTPAFGAVAPIGGVLMIGAWLLLGLAAFRGTAGVR